MKYDYDARGRPVRKWRGDPSTGWLFDQLWVHDGDQLLLTLDANMNRVEEYAYAPGIDRPIATIRGNTGVDAVGYHLQDELGNIIGVVESNAFISQSNYYDTWGYPGTSGTATNSQLFWKGLKWEGDVVSLYYMRNRWYEAESGRFMNEDPIGLEGGINMYTFVGNDPVNGHDPYGLSDCYIVKGTTWSGGTRLVDGTWQIVMIGTPDRLVCPGSGPGDAQTTGGGGEPGSAGMGAGGGGGGFGGGDGQTGYASGAITPAFNPLELIGAGTLVTGIRSALQSAGARGTLTGFTKHGMNRVINNDVGPRDIRDALRYGESITRFDDRGRVSFRFVGPTATVILNRFGQLVSAWRAGW